MAGFLSRPVLIQSLLSSRFGGAKKEHAVPLRTGCIWLGKATDCTGGVRGIGQLCHMMTEWRGEAVTPRRLEVQNLKASTVGSQLRNNPDALDMLLYNAQTRPSLYIPVRDARIHTHWLMAPDTDPADSVSSPSQPRLRPDLPYVKPQRRLLHITLAVSQVLDPILEDLKPVIRILAKDIG